MVSLCLPEYKVSGGALECDILRENIDHYVTINMSEFTRMIRLEYILRTSHRLPVNDITDLFKGKDQLSTLSKSIMKSNIYGYLSNYQYDYMDKQKVCNIVGFDIKDVLLEEKKSTEMKKL